MYKCEKCNTIFDRKFNLLRHQNKKFDCGLKNKENENKSNNENNKINEIINIPKNSKNKIEYLNTNDLTELSEKNNFSCEYCFKIYSTQFNLNKHLKINCKVKKEKDNEKENIFKMLLKKEEQVNKLIDQNQILIKELTLLKKNKNTIKKNQSTKNINSNNAINFYNTTNTTNNNLVIFNFGKEDLGIIDKQQYFDRVVKKPISGVKIPEEILKIIHFNPKYPQLSNIYISDINREKCMVWEDGDWKLSPVDKIPQVIDRVVIYSNEIESELRDQYLDNKKVNERLDIVNKYVKMNDSDYVEELKEDIESNGNLIKRCEDFQQLTYDTFKTTLYNEGKNVKKIIKKSK